MKPSDHIPNAKVEAGRFSLRLTRATLAGWLFSLGLSGFVWITGAVAALNGLIYGQNSLAGSPVFQWAGAVIVGGFLAWIMVDITSWVLKLTVAVATLVETVVLAWLISLFGGNWSPVIPVIAGLGSVLFGIAYARTAGGKRKQAVEALFSGKISKQTANAFIDADEPICFQGEQREASFLICELSNLPLLESLLTPANYLALLNGFGSVASFALKKSGGIVESSGTDRLTAFWGVFIPSNKHASEAGLAALCLTKALERFRNECIQKWEVVPEFRAAVNSGDVVVGVNAASELPTLRVAGDALDFCLRLCQANQFYGSQILVGPRTFELASPTVEVRPVEIIRQPRESGQPVELLEIYELLASKEEFSPEELERRNLFWKGVILYREHRWEEAKRCFEEALNTAGSEDGPARLYLNRIALGEAGMEPRTSGFLGVPTGSL